MRQKGSNSHGNKNEHNLVKELDGKKIKELNSNLKKFIEYIHFYEDVNIDYETQLEAKLESNTKLKQDIYITVNNKKIGISMKMGSGNSVHQEKCEDFISYIESNFSVSEDVSNAFRLFIWADGTRDGSGCLDKNEKGYIISRFGAREFKNRYPEKRKLLQEFLNNHDRELMNRFLFEGKHNSEVDYIYHGTPQHGTWIHKEKIIEHLTTQRATRSCLYVGKLSLQSWNISRNGNNENKRGELQVKYKSLEEDVSKIMTQENTSIGTVEGNVEEFILSKVMNKNKGIPYWSVIEEVPKNNNDEHFVVKVTSKQYSNLSEKLVYPKSDAFIIRAKLDRNFLLEKEFVLTEKDLANISNYEIIDNTGISIKLKDSKNFTIQKLTKNSFLKAFEKEVNIKYLLVGLLVYSDLKQIHKNDKIFTDLNIDKEEAIDFFKNQFQRYTLKWDDKESLDFIRTSSQEYIKSLILNDFDLKLAIFQGKGWFNDPYFAKYLFVGGNLIPNDYSDFSITTGSGRSKGKYSIEIKPSKSVRTKK